METGHDHFVVVCYDLDHIRVYGPWESWGEAQDHVVRCSMDIVRCYADHKVVKLDGPMAAV